MSASFSPTSATIGNCGRPTDPSCVTVDVLVSDNVEVQLIWAYLYNPAGTQVNGGYTAGYASRINGDKKLGTYRVYLAATAGVSGNYLIRVFAEDASGNRSSPTDVGFVNYSSVPQSTDAANPVMVVGSGVLSSSSMTTSGGSVSITYRLTDDLGCCGYHQAWMYYPNGTVVQQVAPSLISGNSTDGTFRASFNVPSGVAAGNYEIKAQATDLTGKYTNLQLLGTVNVRTSSLATFTVTYNGNGGGINIPASQTKIENANLILSNDNPSRPGYTFTGWNTSANGSGTKYDPVGTYSVNANVTLYAQWNSSVKEFSAPSEPKITSIVPSTNSLTIYWDKPTNDGGAPITQYWAYVENGPAGGTAGYCSTKGALYCSVSGLKQNTNYFVIVSAWSQANGVTKSSGDQYSPRMQTTTLGSATSFTVSFDTTCCGPATPATQTKFLNVPLTITTQVPTRAGATFIEWNTGSYGGGTSYAPGSLYSGNSSITLYAQWKSSNGVTYTVTYDANGGSGAPSAQTNTTYVQNPVLTLSAVIPTRSGYKFTGWDTSQNGGGYNFISGGEYKFNVNATLYAQWIEIPFPNIQTAPQVKSVTASSVKISLPATPSSWSSDFELFLRILSSDGSTFIGERGVSGWSEGAELEVWGTSFSMTSNTSYRAKFVVKKVGTSTFSLGEETSFTTLTSSTSSSTNTNVPKSLPPCGGGTDRTPGVPKCAMPENLGTSTWNEVSNTTGEVVNGAVCSAAVCGANGEWRTWPSNKLLNDRFYSNGYPEETTYIQAPTSGAAWGKYYINGVYETAGGEIYQPGSIIPEKKSTSNKKPGLVPRIGPVTNVLGGCQFQILNYDSEFTWYVKGPISITASGLALVTVPAGQRQQHYVSTSREGYETVNALETMFECESLTGATQNPTPTPGQGTGATQNPTPTPGQGTGTTPTPTVIAPQPTSTASIQSCYQAYDFGQLGNVPQVIVSNRLNGAISLDLLINGIDSGSCVGVDIWMGKESKPIFSIFGIYGDKDASSSTPKFRLYLADALLSCTPLTIRGWYTSASSRSQYGTTYNSTGCNGMAPEQSQLVAQSKGYLLANQSALDSLANERAKYSGIVTTDSSSSATTGSNSSSGVRGVPPRPSSPRLKITELKVQLTVTIGDGTTPVTGAYLFNPELGYGIDNILAGTVIRNQAIFEFPLNGATAGTSTVAEIYSANSSGTSQALELPIALPEIQQPASLPGNSSTKPSRPSNVRFGFSGLNVTITVDLPNQEIAKASNVVLTSPLLGYSDSSPLSAKISGNTAVFEIRLTQLLLGRSAAMQIYSVNASGQSESLDTELKIPVTTPPTQPQTNSENNNSQGGSSTQTSKQPKASDTDNKFVPPTPESPKYRIQNGSVIVTVEAPSRSGGKAETAYLVAPGVGITKDAPLKVKVKNDQAVFTIPIYESMAGKSTEVAVYSFNDAGLSKPLAGNVTIPKNLQGIALGAAPAPAVNAKPLPTAVAKASTNSSSSATKASTNNSTVKPVVKATTKAVPKSKTINCVKGTQVRLFVAATCPTGWTKKN